MSVAYDHPSHRPHTQYAFTTARNGGPKKRCSARLLAPFVPVPNLPRQISVNRFCAILPALVLLVLACRAPAEEKTEPSPLHKLVPESSEDLSYLERAVSRVVQDAVRCTVSLQVGPAHGSGVLISDDGYVLTAAHVVGWPGREVQVQFADGTVAQGTTLGIHTTADLGLAKISEGGPWPYAAIVSAQQAPKVGDWCLAAGNPGGFQSDRSPPIRLGRLIDVRTNVVRTDCPLTGGDSGGPLFDLEGRVIGIHSRIGAGLTENLHGPAVAFIEAREALEAGQTYPRRPPSQLLDRLDVDRDGKISRDELADDVSRRVYDGLVKQLGVESDKSHSIEDLTKALGWNPAPATLSFGGVDQGREAIRQSLARDLFVRGRQVRQAFAQIVTPIQKSVARIECKNEPAALAAIVAADGRLVTKASSLAGPIECHLPDGQKLPARIVGVDKDYDLAVLEIDATRLAPIKLASDPNLAPGRWLITPGFDQPVASVGIVSAVSRKIAGTPAVLGVEINAREDAAQIAHVFPNSGAADAGILDGDVITHVMGQAVHGIADLRSVLQDYRAGDVVSVRVMRQRKQLELDVTLGAPDDVFFQFDRWRFSGPLSRRRDDFPKVVQHDSVIHPSLCGGPVLDLSGHVVGINIARADRVASYAVPSDIVQQVVEKFTAAGAP